MELQTIISVASGIVSIGGVVFVAGVTYRMVKENKEDIDDFGKDLDKHKEDNGKKFDGMRLEIESLKALKEILVFVKDFNERLKRHEDKQEDEIKDMKKKMDGINESVIEIATTLKERNSCK